jgi:hypothetical protein
MDDLAPSYRLSLTCEPSYYAGLPFLVAVELANVSQDEIDLLPFFDLFTFPSPVSFVLTGDEVEWSWAGRFPRREGEPRGLEFGPGARWSALIDLSEIHPDLPPGQYDLTAEIGLSGATVVTESCSVEILALPPSDRERLVRLRSVSEEASSWRAFLTDNWRTPDMSGLSEPARQGLAFHAYLHQAAYGPTPIAALDPAGPTRFGHGILESWATLIRLEILSAARRPEAEGIEQALLERWPGLAWWVAQVHAGTGVLKRLRILYGAESEYAPTDQPRPYQTLR